MSGSQRLQEPQHSNKLSLPPVLEGFATALIVLTALCVLCEAVSTLLLHLSAPYTSPLLAEYFPDLKSFSERFSHLHQMTFFTMDPDRPYMYPAPIALFYAVLFHLSHPLLAYLLVISGSFVVAAVMLGKALLRRGLRPTSVILLLSTTLSLSYPLIFLLKQANMEGFVWIILSVGLLLFFSGRSYAAATFFGVAGAMKIFPFVYLGLLLSRKQYRQTVWGVLVAGVLTVASLWIVYPQLATSWHLIQHGLDQFRMGYMLQVRPMEKGFDHSLWMLIKRLHQRVVRPDRLAPYLSMYLGTVSLVGLALYLLRIRHMPVINQLLCLTVASILLPPTSFDYTLVHLYAPWALLSLLAVRQYGQNRRQPGLVLAMACFVVLMAPETEIIHRGQIASGAIKACALLLLFYVGLRYPFPDSSLDPQNLRSAAPEPRLVEA